MQMSSRVKVNMKWNDPGLAWNTNTSNATAIMLPVDKIWTPRLILDNAIDITAQPYKSDVLVLRNGNVDHAVILFVSVSCEINLFTYPFVIGDCPVAINGWNQGSCGLILSFTDDITMSGSEQSGEWLTENVNITHDKRTYLSVTLSINPFSAVVTLILPSALIILADLVSFALPVQGGERNNLKVTLVLSFTMFLVILNDHLSSGTSCSPLLHYHFCFCLVNLVLSMVTSMVLTRLTSDDSILPCKCSKIIKTQNANLGHYGDAGLTETKTSTDQASEVASLQKIVIFLDNMDQKEQVANSNVGFVDRLDKICFCFFLFIDIIYIIIVVIVTRTDICKPKPLVIWDKEDYYFYFWDYFNDTSYNY
ncbi:5-hydroxytryptamine receptor 3A-like isoform X2 [Carassius gibelio]|uniref:5-hydroxytryptamine receptor 3A-like isoform X2 n=1 Tax=Carassius gibelio TaxID=101364 RepID=UPI00227939A9|nr:5-hydroxytryptamine receptor 3A-like isoform X2 [Carassius gibelio]